MKKIKIKITYDADKLNALKRYIDKMEADILAELETSIGRFYEKYVPPAVRKFIEQTDLDYETDALPKNKKFSIKTETFEPFPVITTLETPSPIMDHHPKIPSDLMGKALPDMFHPEKEQTPDVMKATEFSIKNAGGYYDNSN